MEDEKKEDVYKIEKINELINSYNKTNKVINTHENIIKIEYKTFKRFICINNWNEFFRLYKIIKKIKNDVEIYEMINNKCKFHININGYKNYLDEIEDYIFFLKNKLINFFKDELKLNVNIIIYKDDLETKYLKKLYRIVVQDYSFKIEDCLYIYEKFIHNIKHEDYKKNVICSKYYNRELSYIPHDKREKIKLKMFITNTKNTKLTKIELKTEYSFKNIENCIINIKGYLYIIKEREFLKTNENIYKIGCTNDIFRRFKQYPKGSIIIFVIISTYYKEMEKEWIYNLNNNKDLINRKDIGKEYFEGNYIQIIKELTKIY